MTPTQQVKKNEASHVTYSDTDPKVVYWAQPGVLDTVAGISNLLDFIPVDVVKSAEKRCLFIDRRTGMSTVEGKHTEALDIEFPIVSYSVITGDCGNFKMVMIGCESRYFYIIFRGNTVIRFYIDTDMGSESPSNGVLALLFNNLMKGPRIYMKTVKIIRAFFSRVMGAVFTEPVEIHTRIRGFSGPVLPCVINFNKADPTATTIVINEKWPWPYNLDLYPRNQVNDTLLLMSGGTPISEETRAARRKKKEASEQERIHRVRQQKAVAKGTLAVS